jgi:flagellar FliL protein
MSTATADAGAEAPKKSGGKKKVLLMVAGGLVLLLLLGGGGAAWWMKKKAAEAAAAEAAEADDEDGGSAAPKKAAAAKDPKAVPIFVPLEPFTVNLADREAERYAQVTVSLEIDDVKTGDTIKTYLPVIRNNILMVLSHKSAAELLEREGKVKLAREIQRETARAMGIEVADEAEDGTGDGAEAKPKKKAKKAKPAPLPVTAVHFANFIIQ